MNEISRPEEIPNKHDADATSAGSSSEHPPPEGAAAPQSAGGPAKLVIATRDECLAALSKLPSLLVLGLLKPQVANAMRGPYKDLLEHHRQVQQAPAGGGLATDDLLRIVREKPEFLPLLEGILTDEQIHLVMKQDAGESQ